MPAELEETDENIDPFVGIDITSESDSESDDNGGDCFKVVGSDNGNYSESGTPMDDTPINDILLDSVIHSEVEGTGPDDEDTDTEDEDTNAMEEDHEVTLREDGDQGPAGFRCGFDGVELGFVPPLPPHGAGDHWARRYAAGCVWVMEDWSCSYDAVFMSFWSIYEQSSMGWRSDWIRHSQDWNTPLSNNFDHLIILADTPVDTRDHAMWFSRYRNRFRDQLSQANPVSFPRRGPVPASASRILEIMFGRDTGPYLEQDLICPNCGGSSQVEAETRFLTAGFGRDRKRSTPLQTVWEDFIRRSTTRVSHFGSNCCHCQGRNKVQGLRMPDTPWIWFERERKSPISPSPILTFDFPTQQLSYSLQAIIYAGGNHFTTRFRDRSGRWWNHDGQLFSGVPQSDDIRSEADLLANGSRFACIYIYRRDDG